MNKTKKHTQCAVLTGDIVDSSKINETDKEQLFQALRDSFEWITNHKAEKTITFEIFRGDSFQGLIPKPDSALQSAIAVRSHLRKAQPESSPNLWDARIAVGIGSVDRLPDGNSSGDGEAYRQSGHLLDAMKTDQRLRFKTPWPQADKELNTQCALLDAIIAKWSPPQAEAVLQLLSGKSRQAVADDLEISQAAVHYRLKGAGWNAIENFLERYKQLISQHLSAS